MRTAKALGIILLSAVPLYAYHVYNSFFGEEPGYIYDQSTDQLYWLALKPTIYRHEHWKRHLLPFGSPDFRDIWIVGKHRTLTRELAELNNLTDAETIEEYVKRLESGDLPHATDPFEFEPISAEYWARYDLDPRKLTPWQWQRLPDSLESTKGEIFPVDLVLVRRNPLTSVPENIEILRGVLFLGPQAARTVNSYCFFPSPRQWSECTPQGRNVARPVAPTGPTKAARQ